MATLLDKPAALTPKVQQLIVEYVAQGNYFEVACRAAGTTKWTVNYWRKLVEDGAEHAQIYADFFTALARAQATAEVNAVARISGGGRDWQGPAWFIERRFRNRWGKMDREPVPKVKASEVIKKGHQKADDRKRSRKPDGPPC